jgi:hypothetical protein
MPLMGSFEQFLFMVAVAATICWVVYVVVGLLRRRDQLRAASEFQMKLLDRAGSAREFGEVLNSEAGLKLIQTLATEQQVRPELRILRAFQLGLVLSVVGFALLRYWDEAALGLALGQLMLQSTGATIGFIATVLLGTGIGLMIAAGISMRMSRKMGLLADSSRGHSADNAGSGQAAS